MLQKMNNTNMIHNLRDDQLFNNLSENNLKKRLVAVLTIKNNIVVQSIGFRKYLPVGKPEIAIEFLNSWGVDEIIFLDIDATKEGRGPNFELIKKISEKCFVPLTVGGGITNLEQIRKVVRFGADKVSINSSSINNPNLIKESSKIFGNQCIVVSIDVKKNNLGDYEIFTNSGKENTRLDPFTFSQKMQEFGAGEILINSIDTDGSKNGYDLDLIKKLSKKVSIPVIACGGVGHPSHFQEGVIKTNACAFAAGNYFHFTEHSVITTKHFLNKQLTNLSKFNSKIFRLDTHTNYHQFSFDFNGRINKMNDNYLEKIRFEYVNEEEI